MQERLLKVAALISLSGLAACSAGANRSIVPATNGASAAMPLLHNGAGKIKHVVWVVQENRSFDDMFMGYPGADTVSQGKNSRGKEVQLQPISLATSYGV